MLVVASLIYLGVEVVFNMILLEATARTGLDREVFHGIEEFGRRASSSGFALFAIGLFVSSGFLIRKTYQWFLFVLLFILCAAPFVLTPYFRETLLFVAAGAALTILGNLAFKNRVVRSFATVLGISVMAWPAFYNGKVAVIDHYIVNPSSGSQRLVARYVPILRQGLSNGSLELQDISLDAFGGKGRPEAKIFLVMLGPLALNTQSLTDWTRSEKNMRAVVRSVLSSKRMVDIKAEYTKYLDRRNQFKRDKYNLCAEHSKKYINRSSGTTKEAQEKWLETQKEIDIGWEKFQKARERFINVHRSKAERLYGGRLRSFLKSENVVLGIEIYPYNRIVLPDMTDVIYNR